MAAPRKPASELGRTMRYYRKNKKAYDKNKSKAKEINKRPEQRKKRSELIKERRKRGIHGKYDGRDLSHTGKGLVLKSQKANRGSSSDTKGDVNSRGRKS